MSDPPSPTPTPTPPRETYRSPKNVITLFGILIAAAATIVAAFVSAGPKPEPPRPDPTSIGTGLPSAQSPATPDQTAPRWSGKVRLSSQGLDLDSVPAFRGGDGFTVDPEIDVRLVASPFQAPQLYSAGAATAEWSFPSVPDRGDCERQLATQPLSAFELTDIKATPGKALCIATLQGSVGFVRLSGPVSENGSAAADLVVWPQS